MTAHQRYGHSTVLDERAVRLRPHLKPFYVGVVIQMRKPVGVPDLVSDGLLGSDSRMLVDDHTVELERYIVGTDLRLGGDGHEVAPAAKREQVMPDAIRLRHVVEERRA